MKHKIILFAASLFAAASMISCSDYLDKQPLDGVNSATYWTTRKNVEKGLTGVYASFRVSTFSGLPGGAPCVDQEVWSDNAISGSNHKDIMQGGINPSTGGVINDMWVNCYKGIAAANYFLEHFEEASDLFTEEEMNKMRAEVLFIRTYFYNELVVHYGDVPLMLHTAKLGDGYDSMPRTPRAEVVEQMMEDIDYAIKWLPDVAYTDGHAVQGSAIMLKCRILLNDHKYAEAAKLAGDYIHSGVCPFSLSDDYAGIFCGRSQINNPEIMFSIQFAAPDDYHSLDQMVASRMNVYPSFNLREAYEDGDPRIKMTMFERGDPWINNDKTGRFEEDGNRAEGQIPFTGMAFKKYVDTTVFAPNGATQSEQHFVKMRFADLLLMYAEAMFESGHGSDPKALKALNDVRQRPGVEMPPKTELTREIIRNERRVELAFEGIRFYDIIRWDIAKDVIPTVQYNKGGNMRKFDGNLWPVPQSQMDIMRDYWQQNAPWN